MQVSEHQLVPYKKWLISHISTNNPAEQYYFYKTVREGINYGDFTCSQEPAQALVVSKAGTAELLLLSAADRHELQRYMVEHYFLTTEIESWYQSRKKKDEGFQHQAFLTQHHSFTGEANKFPDVTHPKESFHYRLLLGINLLFWISATAYNLVVNDDLWSFFVFVLIPMGLLTIAFLLLQHFWNGFFLGIIQGNAVRIHEQQLPEVYKMVVARAKMLNLAETPKTYLIQGGFNAFVFKFIRHKVLVLQSEVVETLLNGQEDVLNFVIGHELGHIKRNHLKSKWWLFPANLIPLMGKAYSRGCEYTCDRIGYHSAPQGAVKGILILAVGKELYARVDPEVYAADAREQKGFWSWLAEKFSTHPHLGKRLCEIKRYNEFR